MKLYPQDTEPAGGIRVFCGDDEITNECIWADPDTGEAEVFLRDAEGHFHTVDVGRYQRAVTQLLTGCTVKAKTAAVEEIVKAASAP